METLVIGIHIIVCLFLIIVVLVQGGNQGGIGAALGGGNSAGLFGASGATSLLGRMTYAAAFIFMITTICLTFVFGTGGRTGLSKKLKEAAAVEQKAEVPAPAAITEKSVGETQETQSK